MATVYRTPGVYIEEISKFPPSIAQVETAIPAFIGYTEKALLDNENMVGKAVHITSLLEYVEIFGLAQPEENLVVTLDQQTDAAGRVLKEFYNADFAAGSSGASRHVMYYCLQQFFANGGGPCYIVSVGTYLAFGTDLSNVQPYLDAITTLEDYDEPTLLVFPEGQGMGGSYFQVLGQALAHCQKMQDRFTIADLQVSGVGITSTTARDAAVKTFRDGVGPSGALALRYGAAYFPNIRSQFDYRFDRTKVLIRHLINHQAGGAFDGKTLADTDLPNALKNKVEGAVRDFSIYLPPSASVAGVYARVDNARGVWKAPANEGILSIDDVTYVINDDAQAHLNVDETAGISINCIRAFPGKGIKIWGGRTMDGNDNEWRYVSVRRFFIMVEESVKKATMAFVFEPNDRNTWVRVRAMIENFLTIQWRAGALAGAVPEHAFFVKVGLGETMTALDILEGRMIIEIGMAAVRPAEFIILRFSHKMQES